VTIDLAVYQDEDARHNGQDGQDNGNVHMDEIAQAPKDEPYAQQQEAYIMGESHGNTPFEREWVAGIRSGDH
jgi:hypothetical protein